MDKKFCNPYRPECGDCAPHRPECGDYGPEFSPVPPPIAPFHPIPGMNPQEQMCNLANKVNECIGRWNCIQAECFHTLDKMYEAAVCNDVYYDRDEVKLETGYSTNDECPYHIITIRSVDKACQPIRVKLYLAYGNTTNSGLVQSIQDASFITNANAIITAVDPSGPKWKGNARYMGAAINGDGDGSVYVAGFNMHGALKVFPGNVDEITQCQNQMVDMIGAVIPIITDGEITAEAKALTTKASISAIGYRSSNGDKIFFQCSAQDQKGMQGITVANLLKDMGCYTAVITCIGVNSEGVTVSNGMSYMGCFTDAPNGWIIPENAAYWVVSKRPFDGWKNKFTAEIADLVQLSGINKNSIDATSARIDAVQEKADQAIELGQQNADDIAEINAELETIKGEMDTLEADVAQLKTNLSKEIQDRIAGDNALNAALQSEITARQNADTQLNQAIQTETTQRQAADTALDNKIDAETTAREQADTNINNEITNIKNGTTPIPLPIASANTLGAVKVGQNLTITADGTLNAAGGGGSTGEYTAGPGIVISGSKIQVRPGKNVTVDANGVSVDLSDIDQSITNIENGTTKLNSYVTKAGATMPGALSLSGNATQPMGAVTKQQLDTATQALSNEIDDILNGTTPANVPVATTERTGVVKIGSGLNVGGDGTLSVNTAQIVTSEALSAQLANYVTTTSLNSTLTGYVKSSDLNTALEGYVTTEELSQQLRGYVTNSSLTSQLANYVTSQALTERLNGYVTSQALTEQLANYATTAQLANYLPKSGGTMTGAINMNGQKVSGLAEPTEDNDAVRLVDLQNINPDLPGDLSLAPKLLTSFTTKTSSSIDTEYDVTIPSFPRRIPYMLLFVLEPTVQENRRIATVEINSTPVYNNTETTGFFGTNKSLAFILTRDKRQESSIKLSYGGLELDYKGNNTFSTLSFNIMVAIATNGSPSTKTTCKCSIYSIL